MTTVCPAALRILFGFQADSVALPCDSGPDSSSVGFRSFRAFRRLLSCEQPAASAENPCERCGREAGIEAGSGGMGKIVDGRTLRRDPVGLGRLWTRGVTPDLPLDSALRLSMTHDVQKIRQGLPKSPHMKAVFPRSQHRGQQATELLARCAWPQPVQAHRHEILRAQRCLRFSWLPRAQSRQEAMTMHGPRASRADAGFAVCRKSIEWPSLVETALIDAVADC